MPSTVASDGEDRGRGGGRAGSPRLVAPSPSLRRGGERLRLYGREVAGELLGGGVRQVQAPVAIHEGKGMKVFDRFGDPCARGNAAYRFDVCYQHTVPTEPLRVCLTSRPEDPLDCFPPYRARVLSRSSLDQFGPFFVPEKRLSLAPLDDQATWLDALLHACG